MLAAFVALYLGSIAILIWIGGNSRHTASRSTDSYRTKDRTNENSVDSCHMGERFKAWIGISLFNLCDLNLGGKTFYVEGMLWLKYQRAPGWLDHWDKEIVSCPVKALRFVNNVYKQDLSLELEPSSPVTDVDGQQIQWLKFSGSFVADRLDLRRFPFETIRLPIEVELEDMYASETDLEYMRSGSLMASGGELSGYTLKGTYVNQSIHTYRTNWGWVTAEACNNDKDLAEFDNIRIYVEYSRSARSSLLSIFLPLAVMMCVVLCVPLIDIHQHENRVVIPASVLLVLVFLQDGYKKILPPGLSYPTLADLIYATCFILTIGVFAWGVLTANEYLSLANATQIAIDDINTRGRQMFTVNILYLVIAAAALFRLTGRKA